MLRKLYRTLADILPFSFKRWLVYEYRRFFWPYPDFCCKPSSFGLADCVRSPRLIVTMTTFPARVKAVHATIWTLLNQTCKPDMIILWLASEQFPGQRLPHSLLELEPMGLTIRWCEDIRSYKKLVPALREFSDAILVTADDDVLYPPDWLDGLYASYQKRPGEVHAYGIHRITFSETGGVKPYLQGESWPKDEMAYFKNIPVGVGGTLYPPGALHPDVIRSDLFMRLAPTSDDLWFWAMAVRQGTKVSGVVNQSGLFKVNYKVSEKTALCNVNNGSENLNDKHMAQILATYPEIGVVLER